MSFCRSIFNTVPKRFGFRLAQLAVPKAPVVVAGRCYVSQPQREMLKAAEKGIETEITTTGLVSVVPPEMQMKLRDDTLISQLVNTIMRDGKKIRAQKQVGEMLLAIKRETNSDPYKVLADAIELVSPLMQTYSGKKGSKVIQIPQPLNIRQRRRRAITWILDESEKRRNRKFYERLTAEILAIINGTSAILAKKLAQHKLVLANRAQVRIPPNQ